MKNYYEILGIEEEASQDEIRARWAELTKLYHPDLLKSPEADDRIKEINEAYQVLKDYSTRLEYDLERALRRSILRRGEERKRKRKRLQKILIPVSLGAVLAVTGSFIFFSKELKNNQEPVKVSIPPAARVIEPEVPKKPEKPVEIAKVIPREPV
ncbi:MAG: DnaJ domain-containing protein, partial [Thermodesulfobacteriota bacterium]|nr:DnaJ domain-containing protein [Thermodesulfobacteriota bacterium]